MVLVYVIAAYLGSVVASYWTAKFVELDFMRRATEEGYIVNQSMLVKDAKTHRKDRFNMLRVTAIPFFNLAVSATAIIKSKDVYEMWLDASLKLGDVMPGTEIELEIRNAEAAEQLLASNIIDLDGEEHVVSSGLTETIVKTAWERHGVDLRNDEEILNGQYIDVDINNTIIPFDLEPKTYADMTTQEKIEFLDRERISLINEQYIKKSIDKNKTL